MELHEAMKYTRTERDRKSRSEGLSEEVLFVGCSAVGLPLRVPCAIATVSCGRFVLFLYVFPRPDHICKIFRERRYEASERCDGAPMSCHQESTASR